MPVNSVGYPRVPCLIEMSKVIMSWIKGSPMYRIWPTRIMWNFKTYVLRNGVEVGEIQ